MKKSKLAVFLLAGVMTACSFAAGCGAGKGGSGGGHSQSQHVFTGEWKVAAADRPTEYSSGTARRYCAAGDGGEETKTLPPLTDTDYDITENGGIFTYTIEIDGETITFTVSAEEEDEQTCTVVYMDGDELVESRQVVIGNFDAPPSLTKSGCYFGGWYDNPSFTGNAFDFNTRITANKTFYIKWVTLDSRITYSQSGYECAAFEWVDTNASAASVGYKLPSQSGYTSVDSMLIRNTDSNTARVDIPGLKGGAAYDFEITTSAGAKINVSSMTINSFDRSGYAHFGYDDGVGAYNDDGTIKENILVIYLTEDNKNDVLDYCYVDGVKVDITQYVTGGDGTVYRGIGEILNNRRYSGADRKNVGIARLSHEYNGVTVRILGEVSNNFIDGVHCEITGLTDYDSTGNGGTAGDSGAMARMVNAKNVTLEGIGEDATVKGWGFHFVASGLVAARYGDDDGKSFEARNITFTNYPEDALGMEGEQGVATNDDGSIKTAGNATTADILTSVERCWIHNNTFKQGGGLIAGAESDKAEGDGSCDFKRGQYYTNSYNKYENCHKTNLIGNSKDALQFNITLHHNYWYNCQARQPLARHANIHYYNNYIQYTTDPAMSMRADSYAYSEYNYFDGCKQPMEEKSEGSVGKAKSYHDVIVGTFGTASQATVVTDRTEKITNTCKFVFRGIDYTSFDTNPELFYYNTTTKTSDCLISDAITARAECIRYSGVQKRDYDAIETGMSKYTPTSSVTLTDAMTEIQLPSAKGDSEVNGVMFRDMTSANKAKGQYITFKLDTRAEVEVAGSGGDFIRDDGKPVAIDFTEYKGVLDAGVYFIRSSKYCAVDANNIKEVTVTRLAFKQGVSDAAIAQNVEELINAIPAVITESAGAAITAARDAYNALTTTQKAFVSNAALQKLTEAEKSFANIAVNSINEKIAALAAATSATSETAMRELLAKYEEVNTLYNAIPADKLGQVVGFDKVTSGIAVLEINLKPYDVKAAIAAIRAKDDITSADKAAVQAAREAYDSLNEQQKAIVGDITRLTEAEAKLYELAQQTVVISFDCNDEDFYTNKSDYITATAYASKNDNTLCHIDSTCQLTITQQSEARTMVIHFFSGGTVDINGTAYTGDSNGSVSVSLDANVTYVIKKSNGTSIYISSIELLPA